MIPFSRASWRCNMGLGFLSVALQGVDVMGHHSLAHVIPACNVDG